MSGQLIEVTITEALVEIINVLLVLVEPEVYVVQITSRVNVPE